jgi:uncharacterized protein
MITRFELLVVVRTQLADRTLMRRTLAVEAAMEALAGIAPEGDDHWCLAGLGSGIDLRLCQQNPDRLGEMASQLLLTEGAGEAVATAVRTRRTEEPASLSAMAAALCVAETLVDDILADVASGERLSQLEAAVLARRLVRAAEQRGDARAARFLACLERVGLDAEQASDFVLTGLVSISPDLGLQ